MAALIDNENDADNLMKVIAMILLTYTSQFDSLLVLYQYKHCNYTQSWQRSIPS